MAFLFAFPAFGSEGVPLPSGGDEESTRTEEGAYSEPITVFENQGYFRFRSDLFGNRHLFSSPNLGVTGMLPPLSQNGKSDGILSPSEEDGNLTGGANMRLRWEPRLLIAERFVAEAQIDILDNLVMGSTPSYAAGNPYAPYAFASETQVSPEAGTTGLSDAVRVKRAWVTWNALNTLEISAGRMPNQWGLGMLYNDGSCLDCDFGDNVDRLSLGTEWMDIRGLLAWDYAATGALLGEESAFYGQPTDGTRVDDVLQFTLDLGSGNSVAKWATEDEPMAFRWGWRNVWRNQEASSDIQDNIQTIPGCGGSVEPLVTDPTLNATESYECVILKRRDAWLWTTDLTFSLDMNWGAGSHLLLETEMAGLLMGEIGRTQGLETVASDKEIWAGGGIFRGTYFEPAHELGLELGVATGDEQGAFGVLDQSTIAVSNDVYQEEEGKAYRKNNILSSFLFNRAYQLDMLLFREVIGGVTNTLYIKPWASMDFVEMEAGVFGGRVDFLYAAAMMPAGTPGNGSQLGFEPHLQLYLNMSAGLLAVVEGAYLLPLSGLDDQEQDREAGSAWTLQGRMHISF